MHTHDEVMAASLDYFNGNELATNVFITKYALRNKDGELLEKTPGDMHERLALEFARIEKDKFEDPLTAKEIYGYLRNYEQIIPQGSPMYGIGNPKAVSLSNCFVRGTEIFTTSGIKHIENVEVGDKTITHTGETHIVSQLHKNTLNDRTLFDVKCFRTPQFTVTDNHKFLSISKEQLGWGYNAPAWNSIEYLRTGDYIAIPKRLRTCYSTVIDLLDIIPTDFKANGYEYRVKHTGNITQLTTVWYNKNDKKFHKNHYPINNLWTVDENFSYFLGLWYGDGCIFSQMDNSKHEYKNKIRGITFTFSKNEHKIIDFVVSYGEKLFGIKADVNYNKNIDGTTQIVFHSTLIGTVFEKLFGRGCAGKFLFKDVFNWPSHLIAKLVQGLVDSDGCISKNGDVKIVLNNIKLVKEFYHVCRSHSILAGISIGVGDKQYARLELPKDSIFVTNSNKFYNDDRLNRPNKDTQVRHIELGGYVLVRIDKKNPIDITPEYVYTLGVENDHSYSVEGLISQNCFVIEAPHDSYGGICKTDQEIAQISKRRGGVGYDISTLRPAGMGVNNSAMTTTGATSFMHRFSHTGNEVGQNGRRGAQMISISIHHPDIEEFIDIKNNEEDVTGANISIRLSDEFLQAVENDELYWLRWGELSVRQASARYIWDKIIHSAWSMAEPGLLFWDNIIRESPADCYENYQTSSTNPCGEIPLSPYDSCRLLAINLFCCVDDPYTYKAKFNYTKLHKIAGVAQRLMDDLVDLEIEKVHQIIHKINDDPEPSDIKKVEADMWQRILLAAETGRRTGTGITAMGDVIAALGLKYGSKRSIEVVGEIYETLKLGCYRASVDMAKELGAFQGYDAQKEVDNPFIQRIAEADPVLYKDMITHGRRNIACLTTAPTGSVSTQAQIGPFFGTTTGIEPCYAASYTRRKRINPGDKDIEATFVDNMGESWAEFEVNHTGLEYWCELNTNKEIEESPYHGACAPDIDWKARVKLQSEAQKHVDHAISSTINLPEDATEEQIKEIYEAAWRYGLKGITVYRDKCRANILATKEEKVPVERPRKMPCDVHHITVKGQQYFILVGLLEGQPYEVFAGKNGFLPKRVKTGTIIRKRKNFYKAVFDDADEELSPITMATEEMEEVITRLTSGLLRIGAEMHFVVQQLEKVGERQSDMNSFARSVSRALKKYIPDGTKEGLHCPECGAQDAMIRQEGCVVCKSCGIGKCL